MIGRLEKTVLDCPDPRALAAFYAEVLGMRINEDREDWVVIGREPRQQELAFQRVAKWVPPPRPDPDHPQQLHVDIRVDDLDAGEQAVTALGACRLPAAYEHNFRVIARSRGTPVLLGISLKTRVGQYVSVWPQPSRPQQRTNALIASHF
jgi:catechol 2,3-dioxygenase-like lactoylglutathione lyase family enzyme